MADEDFFLQENIKKLIKNESIYEKTAVSDKSIQESADDSISNVSMHEYGKSDDLCRSEQEDAVLALDTAGEKCIEPSEHKTVSENINSSIINENTKEGLKEDAINKSGEDILQLFENENTNQNIEDNITNESPLETPIFLDKSIQESDEELVLSSPEQEISKTNDIPQHTLRVSGLFKSFGRKSVVQGIDFTMHTGEILGLLGPNGAGKTTTFYMIVGFYKPTAGNIFLNEHLITPLPMYKRARLGISYLPQEPSVFKKLTVEENIWSILETRKDLSKKEKKQRLEELIEEFAIGRIRNQLAFTLSGGERRRTEIARSLAIEPKFLLLDEPFAGIDPIAVADIKEMIGLLSKRGIGILITDHNVRDTLAITNRAIIVSSGQISIQGTKQEILESDLAREIYLGKDFSM